MNTGDLSWSSTSGEWHAYINKAPGVSFLAAIPYAAIYAFERVGPVPVDSWTWVTRNAWFVTAATCGVTGALIPAVLYLYGVRRASRRAALLVALGVAFGTIVFPYATMLMAHVPAALFLLLAFVWLDERPALGGVFAGIAGASYYLCIPAAAVMFLAIVLRRGGWRPAVRFAAGGIPFAIALAAYQFACFGSPFRTSVEVSRNFTEKGLLFGVFGVPSAEALWGLTLSEYRGLFFVSPFLILAVFGAVHLKRRELSTIAGIIALFFLANASFNGWEGGAAFGPRYLLPIVPLLAIPLLFLRTRALAIAAVVLGVVSFAIQLLATAVHPTPDPALRRPIREFLLVAGRTSRNTQSMDELLPNHLHAPDSHESAWASFNLGELLFGAGNPMSVLPIVLWMCGGSAWLAWAVRSRPREAQSPLPATAGRGLG